MGGSEKKTITYKGLLNRMSSIDVYIEKGDIIQPPDDANDDDVTTFGYFMVFCIGSMLSSNFESYQRSCQHAVTVWKAGYITTDLVVYTEPDKKNKFAFWLMSESNSQYGIERKINDRLFARAYYYSNTDTFNERGTLDLNVVSSTSSTSSDPLAYSLNVPAPTKDTSAVPKKYVDDIAAGLEPIYGGLTKKTVTYTYAGSERTMDIYIENGDINQPGEDATDEEKDAFARLCTYFFGGVIPSNLEGYINLCQFPVKLWKSGYILSDTIAYAEPEKKHVFSMKLLDAKNGQHSIVCRIEGTLNMVAYYYSSTDTFNEGGTYEKNIKSSVYRAGTPLVYNLDVSTPSRDTSAVPKSYVDEKTNGKIDYITLTKDCTIRDLIDEVPNRPFAIAPSNKYKITLHDNFQDSNLKEKHDAIIA